ncbi:MAG: carboxy terminal-processing peptidase [Flavobacteriaceae bacterium]
MKKNASYLIFAVAVVLYLFTATINPLEKEFVSNDKDRLLIELISHVIQRGHYDVKSLNDDMSEQIFHTYLESLDGQKRYFLQSDYREFSKYMYQIDDQIRELDLTFFDLTYKRLVLRMSEVESMYSSILSRPFDFDKEEEFDTDYDEQLYPLSQKARSEKWRKQLKLSTLSVLYDKVQEEENNDETTPAYLSSSWMDLEAVARTTTRENMEDFFDLMNELERKDWFDVYINSFVLQFDPHTNYFNPDDKDRFDMSMSGKFEGIGARLSKRDQAIKVVDIIVGGPLWRDQLMEVGDEIQLVRQEDGDAVDIRAMRLDDAIKLIKGPKGSMVYLTVKKVDGNIETIPVKRDLVVLEESYARSTVINRQDQKYGLIHLPKFYVDFKSYKERNAAHDVEQEVINLKEAGVGGLIIDLRNNGGGSLQTVVDIAGLFIDEGPIVQVKSTVSKTEVLRDRDGKTLWNGPMVILVNELSASASEILAAAMQDYERAIVIGSEQTFGKGTVQNVVDLNRFLSNSTYGNLGALKITTDKFYRINGGSTQLEGVKSDVITPDRYRYVDVGERDEDNPMRWDRISPLVYTKWNGYLNYDDVIKQSQDRVNDHPIFNLVDQDAKWIEQRQNDNTISLNYQEYVSKIESDRTYADRFDAVEEYDNNLDFTISPADQKRISEDDIFLEKRERWFSNLSKDFYVEEAVNILQDLKVGIYQQEPLARK